MFKPRNFIVLILILSIFSWSGNNSITDSSANDLAKPSDIFDTNSPTPDIPDYLPPWYPVKWAKVFIIPDQYPE